MTNDSRLPTPDSRSKAVFLDRDGVINELVYYPEHGIVDSPFSLNHLSIYPWASEAICKLHEMGFKVILVSNQPGVAKGFFHQEMFEEIRKAIIDRLTQDGATLDGEYYCMHHPDAIVDELRINCGCRKPEPGLILQAAEDMNIDLASSWMIGDGLTDIQAGKISGCKTILLGRIKCELCNLMDEMNARPDVIVSNLLEAIPVIQKGLVDHE